MAPQRLTIPHWRITALGVSAPQDTSAAHQRAVAGDEVLGAFWALARSLLHVLKEHDLGGGIRYIKTEEKEEKGWEKGRVKMTKLQT